MKRLILRLGMSLLLASVLDSRVNAADAPAAGKQVHTVRGVVRSIADDRKTAVIRHEAIPGYMPAMTMELSVRDPKELSEIKPGDRISFRLVADSETHWIDTLRRIESPNGVALPPAQPVPAVPPAPRTRQVPVELKAGNPMPDAELISETGQRLRLSDFHGRALAFTFIFTRCPLPDFCPRMGQNFSKARELLLADAHSPTNWTFLSISFDPDFDKPAVLTAYAQNYRGENSDRWVFAAAPTNVLRELAPRLDLIVNREEGSFSHNLRTVVIDTRGVISRQFDGNRWKAEELADAIREAAAPVSQSPN